MFKTVSQDVKLQRLNICNSCNNYRKNTKTCKKCGCYMPAKATFASSECPAGLWATQKPGKDLINILEEMILESWNK